MIGFIVVLLHRGPSRGWGPRPAQAAFLSSWCSGSTRGRAASPASLLQPNAAPQGRGRNPSTSRRGL